MESVTIRLSSELKSLISAEARNNGQTQSDYLRQIIETHVGQIGKEKFHREPIRNIALNPVERKTLMLGYQLLLASRGELADELYDAKAFRNAAESLDYGYAGEYPQIFAGTDTELSFDECKLTWDILDMFRVIKYSIRDLGENGWEKTGVVDAERYGTFRGFDFQIDLESKIASYVKFLIRTDRWEEQKSVIKKGGGNSHTEMLPTYRSMLAEFKPIWRKVVSRGGRDHLNAEEIRDVLLSAPGARLRDQEI